MTSSGRCSTRVGAAVGLAAALLAVLPGCAHRARGAPAVQRPRIVLLPIENVTGGAVSTRDLQLAVELALRRKFDVVSGDILEEFLSRHRLRFTGGVNRETALAARDDLGADAILVTSLVSHRPVSPPSIGMTMRLVSAGEEPIILWMDHASFSGDEAPGLLGLGLVDSMKEARERAIRRLVASLERTMDGDEPDGPGCGGGYLYDPKVRFRSPMLDDGAGRTLAVLPFLNRSGRRGAGEAVSLEFVRQLVATGQFRILEPGLVREYMLRARVTMPGGVSLETTRLLLGAMEVDLVLSGVVLDYAEGQGARGPTIRFTASMLEGQGGGLVWQSRSFNKGDDGVLFFGLGRVATAGKLTCRMVSPVAEQLVAHLRRRLGPAAAAAAARDAAARRDRRAAAPERWR
ncbi:MAG TPA: hypothetical protein VLS93_16190 [Anaeromyxobacteraceae bacterium]|nr:hypothetical protein [Anaeromyxobacteraceae bacterium]